MAIYPGLPIVRKARPKIVFCHYCYEEIIENEFVARNDEKEYYHIECFAEKNGVELEEEK